MYRIHIIGCGPRTGTTLLAEALKSSFNIDYCTEHEDRIFVNRHGEGKVFLTKHPNDVMVIRPFLYVMPQLYVIYMLRDPRDMVVSSHGSKPGVYWCSLRYWKAFTPCYRKIRNHPRVITVRYEDLVTNPDRVQEEIRQRMPFLVQQTRFSTFHKHAGPSADSLEAMRGVRPISGSSIGRWKEHLPRIAGQLSLHGDIAQDLVEFGYEENDAWLDVLKDVKPDTTPGKWPEFFSDGELKRIRHGKYRQAFRYFISQRGFGLHRLARWM